MYWFEAVLLVRRSTLVLASVMLWRYPLYRAVCLSLACWLWLSLHFFLKPHQAAISNRVESLALLDLAVLSSLQMLQIDSADFVGLPTSSSGGSSPPSAQLVALDVLTSLLIIPPALAMLVYILRKPMASIRRKITRFATRWQAGGSRSTQHGSDRDQELPMMSSPAHVHGDLDTNGADYELLDRSS